MNTPLISIIVPVYNSERYLCRCLDSILNQKLSEWECILIDDGSKDGSGKICDDYEGKDIRIKTYHVKNGGPSRARNIGLSHAKGIWVSFVDSDDWINPNFLSNMIENSKNTDIVFSSFTVHYQGKTMMPNTLDGYFSGSHYYSAIIKLYNTNLFGYTWLKLYKRKIIEANGIRFDENISYMEDTLFTFQYLNYGRSIRCINNHDYQYNLNDNSISFNHHDAEVTFNTSLKIISSIELLFNSCDDKDLSFFPCQFKAQQIFNFLYSCFLQNYCFRKCLRILKLNLLNYDEKERLKNMHQHKAIYIYLFSSRFYFFSTCILKLLFGFKTVVDYFKSPPKIYPCMIWKQ